MRDLPFAHLISRNSKRAVSTSAESASAHRAAKNAAGSGTVTGVLRITDGAMFAPEQLAGSLHLDKVELGQAGVVLKNAGPIAARFGHGSVTLERASFVGPGSEIHIEGGAAADAGLGLSLAGSVDLRILPNFSQSVQDASGSLQLLDVKVTGPLAQPAIVGRARVDAREVRLHDVPFAIDSVAGQLTFS